MISQIQHHPSTKLIEQFYRGELEPGISVAISAHLELCSCCKATSGFIIDQATAEWSDASEGHDFNGVEALEVDDILDSILSQPQQVIKQVEKVASQKIHLLQHSVPVPDILAKVAGEQLVWKKLPGGINHAPMALDRNAQCEFLYMKPGSLIPQHKHQGMEITLVLDGSFKDDRGDYYPGDFIVRTGEDSHSATSDDGCLCFTVLDSPVIFTSGFARFFNPINRYLFNRVMK
jgi:putative transcriptional regulator